MATHPLAAAACSHHRVASLGLDLSSGLAAVTVQINGRPAHLYLDTGAQQTVLTERARNRLGLPTDWLSLAPVWGIGGASVHFGARIETLEMGGIKLGERSVSVADFGAEWPGSSDGLLGADVLSEYDADIDLPSKRVDLHNSARCGAPMPGWKQPYSRIPFAGFQPFSRDIRTTVTIDGTKLQAVIDTGAERTVVGLAAALKLGIGGSASNGREIRMYGVGSRTLAYHRRFFRVLTLGGEVWRFPILLVGKLPPMMAEMLLGADFLNSRRIWISWKNGAAFLARAHDKTAFKEPGKPPTCVRCGG